jgi:hypothetical protein
VTRCGPNNEIRALTSITAVLLIGIAACTSAPVSAPQQEGGVVSQNGAAERHPHAFLETGSWKCMAFRFPGGTSGRRRNAGEGHAGPAPSGHECLFPALG